LQTLDFSGEDSDALLLHPHDDYGERLDAFPQYDLLFFHRGQLRLLRQPLEVCSAAKIYFGRRTGNCKPRIVARGRSRLP
jgi:hypothetical protein